MYRAQQLFSAAIDAAVPIVADRQPIVTGLGAAIGGCVEIGPMCRRSRALLGEGVDHVERHDELFLPEFVLDSKVGVDGCRRHALRAAAAIVQCGDIQIPHGCRRIAQVYVGVE